MKKIVYDGPLGAGIDVLLPDGRWEAVLPGGELKTSDEHARSLLEQGDWQPVSEKPEKAAKAAKEA